MILRSGMNLGADDYLTKPVVHADLLRAIENPFAAVPSSRGENGEFKPDFSSPAPLLGASVLTPRAAEALLWLSQGQIGMGISPRSSAITESTVKKIRPGNV